MLAAALLGAPGARAARAQATGSAPAQAQTPRSGPLRPPSAGGSAPLDLPTLGGGTPGDSLRVFLVTFGPGEEVWERFGHNAIWVHDPADGTDDAYNWGMFSFSQEGFLPRLLKGTMMYWMQPIPMDRMMGGYVAMNRSVYIQELAILPEKRVELLAALRENALPQNMFYRYDYYRDNCSTRVRDALDRATGGALKTALAGAPTTGTFRWHTRRLLQEMPAMYTGIQLVLGRKADRPIDRWEEAFLPLRLMASMREVRVSDGAGGERPLVLGEREAFHSTGPEEPLTVPSRFGAYCTIGCALAVLLVLLAGAAARERGAAWARVPVALLGLAWALVAGVAGLILLGAWLFTDHVFWYPNWNLLQMSPLGLGLAVALLPMLVRPTAPRWAVRLALACAALSIVGLLLGLIPPWHQQNGEILAFTVPANLGVAAAAWRLRPRGAWPRTRTAAARTAAES